MSVRFKLGTDVRAWVEFEVDDPTPEEIEVLSQESDDSTMLARKLDEAGRLTEYGVEYDDNADYFSEFASPAVLDFEEVDE